MPPRTLPPKLYTALCAGFAAMGASIFGYDLAVISYVLASPNFNSKIIETTAPENLNYTGFITSSLLLGAFVASVPASYAADVLSRRTALTIAASIFMVGGILQTAAQNKQMMMAGRFFAGMGIGQLGVLVPLYQSEIAHPSQRGRLTATFQFFLGVGSFVAGWIAYGCSKGSPNTPLEWRLPMLPAVPLVLLTSLLPESPRWLLIKGRNDEALHTLARLHARGNINDPVVVGEYTAIRTQLEEAGAMDQSWGVIFRDTTNMRKVFYGIILQFATQMTGVSAIQYYANTVYTSVGFAKNALLINSINNVVGLIGEALCIAFLDRFGRRPPLIWGNIVASVMFAIATAMVKQFDTGSGSKGEGVVFVAAIFIYNLAFSACLGPMSWVYPVEIMQNNIRAKAAGITTSASWLANFMIGQVSPKAFANIGWRYYLVFTICSATNALTFWLFFHETKGRTLEEIDGVLRNAHIIVPLSNVEVLDAKARERQFAQEYEGVNMAKQDPMAHIEGEGKDKDVYASHGQVAGAGGAGGVSAV